MSMASLYRSFFKVAPNLKSRSCVFCGKKYAISTGSGVLGKHLMDNHPEFQNETNHNSSTPEMAIQVRNPDSNTVNILIFKWMVESSILLSEIQNDNFVNLLKLANISLWSNERFNDMIMRIYEKMRGEVEAVLEEVDSRVSGVIEFWSSYEGLVYMGVNCNWVDKDWVVHRVLMDVVRVPFPCKRNEVVGCMVKVFQMYNVESKLLCCTMDGTTEELSACEVYRERFGLKRNQFWYIQCIGRMICDVIEAGMCCLKPLLSKIRNFVVVISGNKEILSDFKRFMLIYQEGILEFPLEVGADLFGDFTMLEIVHKAPKSMERTIKKHRTTFNTENLPLNNTDKAVMNAAHKFMQPFQKVMEHLSSTGQTSTVGLFLFYLNHVSELINSCEGVGGSSSSSSQHEWMKTASEAMAKSARTIPTAQLHALPTLVASIFDPRIRKSLLPTALDFDAYLDEAKQMFMDAYDAKKAPSSTVEESKEVSYVDELLQYLSEASLDMDANVLDWWKSNVSRYPRLSLMARDYLAVQPTHVGFDQLFSSKRSRDKFNMSLDHGRMLMCIRAWASSGFSLENACQEYLTSLLSD